jgi:hypothetical protein
MWKGTARLLVAAQLAAILLSACGVRSKTADSKPQTPNDKLLALEKSGAIPKLDRSSSVAGTDANINSIRDDIETYITDNYSTQAQRAAVTQTAKALQNTLLVDTTDFAAVKTNQTEVSHGINCIYSTFDGLNNGKQPAQVFTELQSITANTKSRLLAYLKYNKALDGTSSALPEGDTCE